MRKEYPITTNTQITLLHPSTLYSMQNETIYIDYNYGMQTHT